MSEIFIPDTDERSDLPESHLDDIIATIRRMSMQINGEQLQEEDASDLVWGKARVSVVFR